MACREVMVYVMPNLQKSGFSLFQISGPQGFTDFSKLSLASHVFRVINMITLVSRGSISGKGESFKHENNGSNALSWSLDLGFHPQRTFNTMT